MPWLFWLLALTDMAGIALDVQALHFIAKPLLVPVLMGWLIAAKSAAPLKKIILAGLFFSWLGDVFLLFEYKMSILFIFGLASFLTTHIFYIYYFLKLPAGKTSLLKKQPWLIVLVAAYGTGLVWFLYPRLGDLTLPVLLYATVICIMLICSLHAYNQVNSKAGWYYAAGAMAFVVSDSLLAINKFYEAFPLAGVLIMFTYCAAQFCIVSGHLNRTTYE